MLTKKIIDVGRLVTKTDYNIKNNEIENKILCSTDVEKRL